jgi:catechol-2,3-dioxygenase
MARHIINPGKLPEDPSMTFAMPALDMQLDHVTVVATELAPLRDFLCRVVGLADGPRPSFRARGHWLYLDGRPAVHLIQATTPAAPRVAVPRIDHFALRVHRRAAWAELIRRLDSFGIPFQLNDVAGLAERQLFVALSPGIQVEFVTSNATPG